MAAVKSLDFEPMWALKRLIKCLLIIHGPKSGSQVPQSQSEALGKSPLIRSQLTLGIRGKKRIERKEEYLQDRRRT